MKDPLRTGAAFCSVLLGLLAGTWLWLIPVVGLPVSVGGMALGALTLKSERHNAALAGTIFSLVALFLSVLNLVIDQFIAPGML